MKKPNYKKRNPIDQNKEGYCTNDEKAEAKIAEKRAIKEARKKQEKFEKENQFEVIPILRGVKLKRIKK